MTDSRSITGIFVFAAVLLVAVFLGVSIVTEQIQTLAYVAAGTTLITCVALGRRIWMIIPFAAALNVTLQVPGQPTTLLLAQALFCGFCVLLFLLRKLPFEIQFTELEFWIFLLTLCVGQAYLRNPVGLNIFGGDSVGARPYAIFGASLMTCLFLSQYRVPAADLKWLLRLSIIGGLLNFTLLTIGAFVPRVGIWYGAAEAAKANVQQGAYGVESATRIGFLGKTGGNIALWISAFKSPIKACFHPIWAPLVLLTFAFAAFSGFRNQIGAVGLTYLVAIAYRGGLPSILIASFTLILGIVSLAFLNLAAPRPANIQRSLSFLPGTWDEYYKKDAANSTQWRVDMWEEALLTDFWIKNKILGDGLGMTNEELRYISDITATQQIAGAVGTGKLTTQQEFMMASNNYHSGPVSTVRTIGYLGLLVLLLAQIRLAVHAHRQIKRARRTEWFPLSLLIGIPIIFSPFFFVFIYGEFGRAAAAFLMGAAFVKMLENNLPLPKYGSQEPSAEVAKLSS